MNRVYVRSAPAIKLIFDDVEQPAMQAFDQCYGVEIQRLYLGNLKVGAHELVAFFNGKGPNDRPYKRGASLRFEKGVGAKYLELKIDDRQRKLQPEFEIKDWE